GLPLVGNVVVALLVAATFEAGALAAGALPPAVHFLAGLALLANVGREVWKDAEDAEHDAGRTTFAQLAGLDRAHAVARVATLAAVLLSPLPFLYGFGGWPFLAVVALADALFITAALRTKPSQAQRFSKLGMLTALAAFTLGAIA
ncbi:MAG: geranylgeranylglycerol-phosphate geranylgeranyltransferase, partial [Candidatus Thermoplasmatota archaeon]|nr:geranylgeranylglycerol-phosphate geranylgeranyltransferase [Candidatus Thermoplasmatota archaeon]